MTQPHIFREPRLDPKVRLLTVDIFDTLLLRRPISERRRQSMVTRIALADPRARVVPLPARLVCHARAIAQDLAYRELEISGREGEVRLTDIVRRQLALLGLPEDLCSAFLAAEVAVEKRVLLPNGPLIELIGAIRRHGVRVVGLSDTGLSRSHLMVIIEAVAGQNVLDELYTSADLQATKRKGDAFKAVCKLEGVEGSMVHHLGDDYVADCRGAASLGITTTQVPRSTAYLVRRRLDAARFMIDQWLKRAFAQTRRRRQTNPADVLGPVVADFCMRLWLYLSSIPDREDVVVLFCARGGVNMHLAFERFVSRLGLPLPVRCCDLMVSRLVAMRGPLLASSDAAREELAREFMDSSMSETARALTGANFVFEAEWHNRFDAETFIRLMSTTATGAKVRGALTEQAGLFTEHLASLAKGAKRLVLCDTGLYGSTMRLLQAAYPEYEWECLLFARRNYKSLPAPHFARTVGLSVESETYNPFDMRTAVLRYWQLIESLFEPALPSVKAFRKREDGTVVSNLEVPGWRQSLKSRQRPAFMEVLRYLSSLDRYHWFDQVTEDCGHAWRGLRSTILFPAQSDTQRLTIRTPTRDLGRNGVGADSGTADGRGFRHRIDGIRSAYWREGYIAQAFPHSRWPLLVGMEAVHVMMFAIGAIRRYELPRPGSVLYRGGAKVQRQAKRRRIGFFGFFGSGNTGNDGSLETMLRFVRAAYPDVEVLCICAEPAKVGPRLAVDCVRINWRPGSKTLQRLDRWLYNIPREIVTLVHCVLQLRRLDVLIIPGTGILDDFCTGPKGMPYWLFRWSLLARLTGTRVAFVSIGAGPIHHPLSRWMMKMAAEMASYRSFRDRYSLEYMRGIGSDVSNDAVYPDVAFALPEPAGVRQPSAVGELITVSVGVMYYNGWRGEERSESIYEDYLRKMRRFIDWLLQEGYGVRVVMGDGVDRPTLECLKGLIETSSQGTSHPTAAPAETLHDLMAQIAETDVVVATRYHNVVCALKLGRPTLSIGYATKNDELMAEMGLGDFCQHIERLDVDQLIAQFRKLIAGRKTYERLIRETTARFKDSLRQQEELLFSRYLRGFTNPVIKIGGSVGLAHEAERQAN